MGDQRTLHLGRAHAVAGNIDYVVHTAGNPVIAILVATAAIASKIFALVGGKIGLLEAFMVAIKRAHLPRPRIGDAEISFRGAVQWLTVSIDDLWPDAEERQRCRAGLELRRPRQRSNENAAGLSLPPGIDDRATAVANHFMVPHPGLRIDRLADRA